MEVEDRVARVTSHSNAQACRRNHHGTCLAPRHTLRDVYHNLSSGVKANWARSRCDTPTSDGLGRCAAHTHCLNPILITVTRENGKPSSCPTEALNRCPHFWGRVLLRLPNGPSLSWEFALVWKPLGYGFCCFSHSNDTETIPTPCPDGHHGTTTPANSASFSAALACMDVHSNNFMRSSDDIWTTCMSD